MKGKTDARRCPGLVRTVFKLPPVHSLISKAKGRMKRPFTNPK
jgi:hypothetical protein